MATDEQVGFEELPEAECLRLLGSVPLGRLVFTLRALPAVRPVNHIVDGTDVVIRSCMGSKVAAAVRGAIVAYEADEIDPERQEGWSVVVTGVARLVHDPDDLARYERLVRSWVPAKGEYFIRIRPEIVTGRRITHRAPLRGVAGARLADPAGCDG